MKVITIFGGTTLIGRYLINHLLQYNYKINIVSRSEKKMSFFKCNKFPGQISQFIVNVMDYTELTSLIQFSNIIINCIGISDKNEKIMHKLNCSFPTMLADYCKKYNVEKFIHFSSIEAKIDTKFGKSMKNGEEGILENEQNKSIILRYGFPLCKETKYLLSLDFWNNFPFIPIPKSMKNSKIYTTDIYKLTNIVIKVIESNKFNGKIYDICENNPILGEEFIQRSILNKNKENRKIKIAYIPDFLCEFMYSVVKIFKIEFLIFTTKIFKNIGYKKEIEIDKKFNISSFGNI